MNAGIENVHSVSYRLSNVQESGQYFQHWALPEKFSLFRGCRKIFGLGRRALAVE